MFDQPREPSLFTNLKIREIWDKIDDPDFLVFLDNLKALPEDEWLLAMGAEELRNSARTSFL